MRVPWLPLGDLSPRTPGPSSIRTYVRYHKANRAKERCSGNVRAREKALGGLAHRGDGDKRGDLTGDGGADALDLNRERSLERRHFYDAGLGARP